jgi:hypothetical protein
VATTQQLLDEARVAYHRLQVGLAARVVVDTDSSRIEFTAANRADLAAYIRKLEMQLAAETGTPVQAAYSPATFSF